MVSDWRILIEYRRIADSEASPFPNERDVSRVFAEFRADGSLRSVEGVAGVYLLDVPFAEVVPATEEQIVQEADPTAVFSHLTALVHHALTDQLPNLIQVTHYNPPDANRIPLGTTPEEWAGLPQPTVRKPKHVRGVPVRWFATKGDWDFGHEVNYSQGLPVYITDRERTLIDILRTPEGVGGMSIVVRAWKAAKPLLNLDRMIE